MTFSLASFPDLRHISRVQPTPQKPPRLPKEGDLRVYSVINEPGYFATEYPVRNVDHARRLLAALKESHELDPISDNLYFGLVVYKDGAWTTWQNEHGLSINDLPF